LPRKARWVSLLDDPGFKRWYDNTSRGSKYTATENARVLYRFLEKFEMTPNDLVELAKKDVFEMEDFLMDFVSKLHEEDYAPSYINNYIKTVRSWLRFNGINLVRRIKVGNLNHTPTIEDERVPTNIELKQILSYAMARGSCSISFMAFSGFRPQTLGNINGIDGLKIKDLPELRFNGKEVIFDKIPTMVVVRSELSKAKHRYFSFLGPEGCEYLKAYFEMRLSQGEKISPESAVISYKKGYEDTGFWEESKRENNHIATKTITQEIRTAMRPRFTWRPYVLRAYFDTQLLIAESNGKIPHAYRQFFMGHKGDIEARYTTNKGRLPEDLVEDMREAYRRSLEYLETSSSKTSTETLQNTLRKELLLLAGFSGEEIEKMDLRVHDKDFQEMLRQKIVGSMINNGNTQKVVNIEDVVDYINRGWQFVAKLTDEQVIIRLP
jgi:integrase